MYQTIGMQLILTQVRNLQVSHGLFLAMLIQVLAPISLIPGVPTRQGIRDGYGLERILILLLMLIRRQVHGMSIILYSFAMSLSAR